MDATVKGDFLVALRDGSHTQTHGALAEGKKGVKCHCALGVLADLAVQAGVVEERCLETPEGEQFYTFNGFASTLHPNIDAWADISAHEESTIMRLNDTRRWTYEQIADFVEENF